MIDGGSHDTMRIRLITTGGTFDKEYNEITGELYFNNTHVREILKSGRCTLEINMTELMMIDSSMMTDTDRKAIYKECLLAEEDRIIITHGTDKMVETAIYLKRTMLDKTIVLTGAIVPYAFGESDSLFNLGSALAFVQMLPRSVFIVFNGRYFDCYKVKKDMDTGIFHEIDVGQEPTNGPSRGHRKQAVP
jgi:L-asparaginase